MIFDFFQICNKLFLSLQPQSTKLSNSLNCVLNSSIILLIWPFDQVINSIVLSRSHSLWCLPKFSKLWNCWKSQAFKTMWNLIEKGTWTTYSLQGLNDRIQDYVNGRRSSWCLMPFCNRQRNWPLNSFLLTKQQVSHQVSSSIQIQMADQAHPRKMSYDWIGFETQNANQFQTEFGTNASNRSHSWRKIPLSETDYVNDDAIVDEILTL